MSEPWDKAKSLLRTALNEVEKLSEDSFRSGPAVPAVRSTQVQPRSSGVRSDQPGTSGTGTQIGAYGEHRKLFGFKPPGPQKGKRSRARPKAVKKAKVGYTKDTVLLRCHDQTWLPSTEERMQLAKIGLGFKKALFEADCLRQMVIVNIFTKY